MAGELPRRRLLKASVAAGITGIAGCTGGSETTQSDTTSDSSTEVSTAAATTEEADGTRDRIAVIEAYADRVLSKGRDRWSGVGTPLLADGVHVDTDDPVVWRYDDEEYVISNLASQQNLFRMLTGLSNLTGDSTYVDAAKDVIEFHYEKLDDGDAMARWGGHQFIDLGTLESVGHFDADVHELKNHFPFYELMWDVDEAETASLLRTLWGAHVIDWSILDMNRHAGFGAEFSDPWGQSFADPDPFFEGDGLTFINIGSDLIYAAGTLARLADEQSAWDWGRELAGMYVDARHPDTGLGAYQYSKPRREEDPPEDEPLTGRLTYSDYGDRAENQFGEQFGDVAREGWALWGWRLETIYVENAFMQLTLAESMGADGEALLEWTADGLAALSEYGYMPSENAFRPMWADGTDLTGKTYDRTGYYGEEGTSWEPITADAEFLLTFARASRLTERASLWETTRRIADGLGIGDIGERSEGTPALAATVTDPTPTEIFALLELYRTTEQEAYLDRAERVADRLIEERYHHGYFLPSAEHVHANFDTLEPLAILALEATIRGEPEAVPAYVGGEGYIHGTFDDLGRVYDEEAIWSVTREES
ncbi:MAG: hypothetical protein ACOCQY_04415 [Halorhabdus sp.]